MAPKARVQKRLYYKIGEACKALGIQPYVLRYWETEFPALSPSKSRSGQRVYSEKELDVIRRIKQLLYDEGYTIAGAKKKLEAELAAGTLGEPAAGATAPTVNGPGIFQTIGEPRGHHHRPASPAAAGTGMTGTAGAAPGQLRALPLREAPPETAAGEAREASTPARAERPALPLVTPAAPGEPMAAPPAAQQPRTRPAAVTAPVALEPSGAETAAPAPAAAAVQPVAAMPPTPGLDTSAAKQVETLRKGIQQALQEARELLALLDSRSPR